MENNNSLLNRLNPVAKLILIIIPTVIVSFAYDIYTPTMFFLSILVLGLVFGQINIFVILRSMIKFILVGISFSLFIIVTRAFTKEGLTHEVIITAISISLRIMVFSITSILFVKTTDPNEFALSLIHQLKMSYKVVYPFLIAYRFIPTFQDELEKIILAKEVRGISLNKVYYQILLIYLYSYFRYLHQQFEKGNEFQCPWKAEDLEHMKTEHIIKVQVLNQ